MPSYLGLYVEDNLIKYAKVTKNKQQIKVDSFGIKFYSDIYKAIEQIVEETNSAKTPISVNLKNESYQYFNMFALLNKKDLEKSIKLEFESYCSKRGYNVNSLETKYAIVNDTEKKEQLKVINISASKTDLQNIEDTFSGYKVTEITPVSMSIANIMNLPPKENALIINMENNTTVTTVIDGNVFNVATLDMGSTEILEKINERENSYAKSYEICQNTTIYTAETMQQELTEEESQALADIMPTLYEIVGNVQKIINETPETITKIYLTGTLCCINNIDLYFEEYLGHVKCEILKPFFISSLGKEINVKDYIEVNSAVSLALQGLGEGIKGINFRRKLISEGSLNISFNKDMFKKSKNKTNKFNMNDFHDKLSRKEMGALRGLVSVLIFIVIFDTFSILLTNQIKNKEKEVENVTTKINTQIAKIKTDTSNLTTKATQYTEMTSDLQEVNKKISDLNASKNLIPNLLNQIMSAIDETVQLTSIENTTDKHIVIIAQSEQYPGLGYFKTKLKTKNILQNVVSGSSMKQDGVIKVTIEGDLP